MAFASEEDKIREFALEAILSLEDYNKLRADRVTRIPRYALHISLAYYTPYTYAPLARDLRDDLLQVSDSYRDALPEEPVTVRCRLEQIHTHRGSMRRLKCIDIGNSSSTMADVRSQFGALLFREKIGWERQQCDLYMTLEPDGLVEGEYELTFNRFAITPWTIDKAKHARHFRFRCGWASRGIDHVDGRDSDEGESVPHVATHRFKKELCRFYGQGRCSRGEECTYAHGERDLR